MPLLLIVDDRERALNPHLDLADQEEGKHFIKKRLQIGDYAIVEEARDKVLAVFERKTLKDFSSSLSDGRYGNKEKMIKLREKTGCQVFFIVEGAKPSPSKLVGGKPYKYIESAIFHCMIRDQIMFLYTKDTLDTIETLFRFIDSMENLLKKSPEFLGGKGTLTCEESLPDSEENSSDEASTEIDEEEISQVAMLTQKESKKDIEIVRELWAKIKNISYATADKFITNYALIEILEGNQAIDEIKTKKFNGRKLGRNVIKSLSSIEKNKDAQAKLLSGIPGVSLATAKEVVQEKTLLEIAQMEDAEIASMSVPGRCRPLGNSVARAIKKYFYYKHESL